MKKGQAAIEFILLVVVMLLFINTAILTNANSASDAALDVSKIGKARLGAEKVVNAINYVGFGAQGTRQTVSVFVPEGATITCNNSNATTPGSMSFIVELEGSSAASGCVDNGISFECSKSITAYSDVTLQCTVGSVTGPTIKNYTISKGSGSTVTVG